MLCHAQYLTEIFHIDETLQKTLNPTLFTNHLLSNINVANRMIRFSFYFLHIIQFDATVPSTSAGSSDSTPDNLMKLNPEHWHACRQICHSVMF